MSKEERLTYERTHDDLFLKFDGTVIAKRGKPDSEKAGTWIALEPGFEVMDASDGESIHIHRYGARVH